MAFNRDLSQLANFLDVNSDGTFVNIIPSQSEAQLGIGTNNPTAKLDVLGNARVSGNLSVTNINASGIVTATNGFVGALTGLASSATQLATGRTIAITGDLAYTSGSFNGTGNVTGVGTLANTTVTPGSYGSSTEVATFTVDSKGRLTAAGTASVGTALTVAGDSGSENISLLSETLTISGGTNLTSSAASNTVTVNLDPNISLTSVVASGVVTATSGFVGNLTGNINSSGVSTVSSLVATNINTSGIVTAAEFKTGASGSAIGINTNTISGPATITLDPAAVGDNTGLVVIKGDLQIDGTTTTINSTTVTVDDKNIQIADGAANDAAADGAGITITSGEGNKTFQFEASGDNLGSSENINVASGKVYKVNNTEVLSSTTLGSGVINSSLTSVGTLTNLSVGNVNSSGIVTATSGFSGNLTGNVTGNINSSGVSTVTSLNATNINASGIVTATNGFVGNLTGLASSATQLQTARDFSISGDATASSISFNGTSNVGLALTLATTGVSSGSYGSSTQIPTFTVDAKGRLTAAGTASVGAALTVAGDSGTETINFLNENLTIAGTAGIITTSAASNTVTLNLVDTGVTAGSYGSSTAIPTFTVDAKGRLTAAGTAAIGAALTVAGDSGTETINFLSENLTISGGTNLTSSAASNTVTVNLDDNISLTSVVASGIVTAAQFVTGASGSAIGINTNTISGPATITIDPAAVGDNTGAVRIKGDLFVDGTQFIVNSTTIELADFVVGIASTATSDILADGAGIKIGPDNTLTYDHTNTALKSSENFNLASGKTYKINGTDVLSSTTLGSNVVNSSLTSVGTLIKLDVGNVNSTGIITATTFAGALTGNVTGNINSSGVSTVTNLNIGGYVSIGNTTGAANQIIASTGVGVTWKTFNDLLPQTRTTQTFTATANQTLFSFVYNVNFLDVFVNGVKLSSAEFTANNGTTITLSEGAFANDTVEFVSYATLGAGTGQVSSLNDLTDVTLTGITTGNLLAYNGSEFVNTSNINVTGIITATSFVGNGSGLTGTGSTVADDTTTNQSFFPVLTQTTTGTITSSKVSTTKLSFNPSTGTLSATSFAGALTGNVTGNVNASGIVTAAQFVTGASGSAIGINTNTISGPATITIDPAAVGDNTGLVVIKGDLQIDGTTTTVNSTTVTVDDKNITLASGAANDAAADGGGITVESGQGNKTFNWVDATDSWTSSEHMNLLTGKSYKINGTDVLTSTTLGSGIVNSSLTSVGTLGSLTVTGAIVANGGVQGNINSSGVSTVSSLSATNINATGVTTATTLSGTTLTYTNGTITNLGGTNVNYSGISTLGTANATTINKVTITAPATSATLTIADGKTLTASNTLTFTGTDASSVAFGAGGTVAYTSNKLSAFSATTSSELAGVISDETGSGALVFATSPTLVTPVLGVATGTSLSLSGVCTATDFNATSDINLKENIRQVESASELVSKLEGVHFSWKETGKETIGVIAQQIEEHLPQLVQTGEDYKTVNYNGLIGVLIEAVKEQGAQIAALQAEIEELKK